MRCAAQPSSVAPGTRKHRCPAPVAPCGGTGRLPGAGGYGDPLERDPELLRADVRDGKVTLKSAREDYKVVIDPETLTIDEEATKRLRGE